MLVGLTGGLASPFFLGFFLVVGGAVAVGRGHAPLLLALLAGACLRLVGLLVAPAEHRRARARVDRLQPGRAGAAGLHRHGRGTRAARAHARPPLRLSRFDPLTGLYNRNYFFAVMEREIRRAARIGPRLRAC